MWQTLAALPLVTYADGCNLYDPSTIATREFTCHSVDRPAATPQVPANAVANPNKENQEIMKFKGSRSLQMARFY